MWQCYFNYVGYVIYSHILRVDKILTTDSVENMDVWLFNPYTHPLVPHPKLSIETDLNMSFLKFTF